MIPQRIMDDKRDKNESGERRNRNTVKQHETTIFNLMGLFSIWFGYLWTQMTLFIFINRLEWCECVHVCRWLRNGSQTNLPFLLFIPSTDQCLTHVLYIFDDPIDDIDGVIALVLHVATSIASDSSRWWVSWAITMLRMCVFQCDKPIWSSGAKRDFYFVDVFTIMQRAVHSLVTQK